MRHSLILHCFIEKVTTRDNILFMTFHYDEHITCLKIKLYFSYQSTTPPFLSHTTNRISPKKTGRNISKPETVFINVIYTWSKTPNQPMAYFWVQLRAVASYLVLSVLYMWAISGTSGSSGFGSVSNEQIESSTWYAKQSTMIIIELILKFILI